MRLFDDSGGGEDWVLKRKCLVPQTKDDNSCQVCETRRVVYCQTVQETAVSLTMRLQNLLVREAWG